MVNSTKKDELTTRIIEVFQHGYPEILAAYLFGSTATGTNSATSDIDIAILTTTLNHHQGLDLKFRLYADLCRRLGRNDIDVVWLNHSRNLILKDHITRRGQVLYSTDDDLRHSYEQHVQHNCTDFKRQRYSAMGV